MTVAELREQLDKLEPTDELQRGGMGDYFIWRGDSCIGMLMTMSDSAEIDWYDE